MTGTRTDILLVDDEARNLDALEAILDGPEYRLLRAEDADRALRLLLEHDVAAIVLDIKMPRINGIELAQIIKSTRRFREIPILFLSAHLIEDQDVVTGYGVGAVDYLTKPFNTQILRHKVAVFADLFRKTRALAELNTKLEERVAERTEELAKSERALQDAARHKDEFLATLAHELRNPLAPLRTGLDLLIQVLPTPSNVVSRTLASMNRQLDHVVRLIDDLLDVSRISRGVLELKKEPTDLTALVQWTAETNRPLFEKRKVQLEVTAAPSVWVAVDPTRISQVVGNLLHNASKFTHPDSRVDVELSVVNGTAFVRVADTGVGIPDDQIHRVFEMFVRIERKSSSGSAGAGIGLALAKRLAEMHGGDLTVSSAGENRGTTFTVAIPGAELAALPPPAQMLETRAGGPGTGLDIVVVEDNQDAADTLMDWLQKEGHRVKVARTGPEGLELVLSTRPQLVLCDIGLPGMDGNEVCRQVRMLADGFRPTMIALTGWGMVDDRERTERAGFDHHLVKPVSLALLAKLLTDLPPDRPWSPARNGPT